MSNVLCTSANISLRRFTPSHAPFILDLLNSHTWKQFIGDRNINTPTDAADYIINVLMPIYAQYNFGPWLVELNDTQEPIGLCGLFKREYLDRPDLGFAFLPGFEGLGLAYEACQTALSYINEHYPVNKLYATTTHVNMRSQRLLERCGFAITGSVTPPACEALLLYTLNLQ